ncbi:MAG: C4-dicarboxylic acid transporter DauA [Pseudomonadota bacterium]|jgi:SulP family sulfate permease
MMFFRPRLIDALHDYTLQRLIKDVGAGLTVAVVALPLAMAFAIASGLQPQAGLITAVVAGFLISLLGGSRVQIGGPAGAFIVIVYGILERHGLANLVLATLLSGAMLMVMGLLRLGTLIRFIPVAVVIGFTNGIAVLIILSQLKDFFGLQIAQMPADFFGMGQALAEQAHTLHPATFGLALASLAVLLIWQFVLPRWVPAHSPWRARLGLIPASLVALVLATTATAVAELPVATIGSRFGGIPDALPHFTWPEFGWSDVRAVGSSALTLALLGAIESLLCARVADQLIDDRHDANQELMAQGIANMVTPLLGGMPATGTIARTMTNVKQGASSPVAGMVHALVLALVVGVAAPLAMHIPLATLSAILVFVAWNMGEWREFAHLRQFRMPYRITLLLVFALTVTVDLTVAVEVGLVAACLTFIYRISSLSRMESVEPGTLEGLRGVALGADARAYRLYGALFFGAVRLVESLADPLRPGQVLVLDLKNLIYMDTTGADALLALRRQCQHKGVDFRLVGLGHQPLDMARRAGLAP